MDVQKTLLGALILGILTLAGDVALRLIDASTAETQTKPDYVEKLQGRITELEGLLLPYQAEIFELKLQKADLERALNGGIDEVEEGGLSAVFANYDFPAWCKRVHVHPEGHVTFIMLRPNPAYSRRYNIDADKYENGTDFDNHPREIAEQYYANDMRIYRSKGNEIFTEAGQGPDGLYRSEERFLKMWVPLPVSGRNYICGFLIPK